LNIWATLGLDPTDNPREIKRAYAKMLAQYHPEEHPEKFEEIHWAYTLALQYGTAWAEVLPLDLSATPQEESVRQETPWEWDTPLDLSATPQEETVRQETPWEWDAPLDPSATPQEEATRQEAPWMWDAPLEGSIFTEHFHDLEAQYEEKEREQMEAAETALSVLAPLLSGGFSKSEIAWFFSNAIFQNVKKNMYFIEGLIILLQDHIGICVKKPRQMAIIRTAFEFEHVPVDEQYIYDSLRAWFEWYGLQPKMRVRMRYNWADVGGKALVLLGAIGFFVFLFMFLSSQFAAIPEARQEMGRNFMGQPVHFITDDTVIDAAEILILQTARDSLLERTGQEWETDRTIRRIHLGHNITVLLYYLVENPEEELLAMITFLIDSDDLTVANIGITVMPVPEENE